MQQIVSRPDSQFAYHHQAITGMEVEESFWKILSHYEVPERLVSLVRNTYQGRHTGLPMLTKRPIAWRLHRGSTRMFTVAIPLPLGY